MCRRLCDYVSSLLVLAVFLPRRGYQQWLWLLVLLAGGLLLRLGRPILLSLREEPPGHLRHPLWLFMRDWVMPGRSLQSAIPLSGPICYWPRPVSFWDDRSSRIGAARTDRSGLSLAAANALVKIPASNLPAIPQA